MTQERLLAAEVQELASEVLAALRPCAERAEVAGSLRRGSPTVKDVEIVLLNPTPHFYELTDEWVRLGQAAKALYGRTQSTRWGDKYRGFVYQGIRFEVFTADSDNWGYIWWLRTGPGEANTFIMSALKWDKPPFVFRQSYAWSWESKLSLATEADLFTLLGLPLIPPAERTEQLYRRLIGAKSHRWGDPGQFIKPEVQAGIFDSGAAGKVEERSDRTSTWLTMCERHGWDPSEIDEELERFRQKRDAYAAWYDVEDFVRWFLKWWPKEAEK